VVRSSQELTGCGKRSPQRVRRTGKGSPQSGRNLTPSYAMPIRRPLNFNAPPFRHPKCILSTGMASLFNPAPLRIEDRAEPQSRVHPPALDVWMLAGIAVAITALLAGIVSTGVNLRYFFQPTAALIVLGGTFGVTLIATPRRALLDSVHRVAQMLRPAPSSQEALIEEILRFARSARTMSLLAIEPAIQECRDPFLKQALALALDSKNRDEFKISLETMLRARERQGDGDAKVLETAGGFAPTIGVIGTVVGLIDVFRHFSDLSAVATGVGTAFVSTIYGLALANLLFLPAAHRIRASLEQALLTDELIAEGALGVLDTIHPTLLRERLNGFLRKAAAA
jgi:chemotaxis protein MotA